ncbi:MAG: cation:proton antiporter, partial [Mycobacteriales bacterium]
MHDTLAFGGLVLAVSAAALLAVQSHGLTARLRVPAPALFLAAAAVLAAVLPGLHEPEHRHVERVVTVALVAI